MKKYSILTSIICVMLLFFTAGISSNAEDSTDDYVFTVISEKDKTCEVTETRRNDGVIDIPSKNSGGYKVVKIGRGAFSSKPLITDVKIPEGVETIGDRAFASCHALGKVQFPSTLRSIGKEAFADCRSLNEVKLPDGLKTIGDEAFTMCTISYFYLPHTVTSVGNSLAYTDLMQLTYDGSEEEFKRLFGDSNIPVKAQIKFTVEPTPTATNTPTPTSTPTPTNTPTPTSTNTPTPEPTLPPATPTAEITGQQPEVTPVETASDLITVKGITYKINKKEATVISASKSGKIVIPAKVKTYKVTGIADKAFKGNKKIKSVTVGANVKTIGKEAFSSCKKLKKLTIGSKVKKIGKNAFRSCKALKTISIKTKVLKPQKIDKTVFKGIYKKATFKVPKKYKKTYIYVINKTLKEAKII